MFERFAQELKQHNAQGYHAYKYRHDASEIGDWLLEHNASSPPGYREFLSQFGSGEYFGGMLVIFPPNSEKGGSISELTDRIRRCGNMDLIPFGYERTTEGCFCFSRQPNDQKVYWFSFHEKNNHVLAESFFAWVESLPEEYFNAASYKAFGQVKDAEAICEIIEEREAFAVKIISFDQKLVRPPDKQGDMLPRYTKITFSVSVKRSVSLKWLTICVHRTGSNAGKLNRTFVSLNVVGITPGKPIEVVAYAFDPFNVPFSGVEICFSPMIDLGSRTRAAYKEIAAFL